MTWFSCCCAQLSIWTQCNPSTHVTWPTYEVSRTNHIIGCYKVVQEIRLYGFLKNALQDFDLVSEASMLNHTPGNAHMGFVWVNAVQFATWG